MGWSASDLFVRVCKIATRNDKTFIDRTNTLIALIDAFEDEDFDTIEECFDEVEGLESACRMVHPEWDWDS